MERDPNALLSSHIQVRAEAAGVPWDTHHADFLLGIIAAWLDQHDSVLAPTGVRQNDGPDGVEEVDPWVDPWVQDELDRMD